MKFLSGMSDMFIGLSIILYLISLGLETICFSGNAECDIGINDLIFGPLGSLISIGNAAWFANPILVLSWQNYKKLKLLSAFLSVLAFSLGTSLIITNEITVDESGILHLIHGYGNGYWLWLISMGLTVMATVPRSLLSRRGSESS